MNKKDLEYFKNKLINLKEETLEEIKKVELIDANEVNLPDDNDIATVHYEQGFALKMRDRNLKYLKKIDKALKTVEDGSYGECVECGNDIALKRLDARPVTNLCLECKQDMEKEEKKGV